MRTQMRQTKTSNHLALELENKCLNFTEHMELVRRLTRGTHRVWNIWNHQRNDHTTRDYAWTLDFIRINCTVTLRPHDRTELINKLNLPGDQMKVKKNKGKGHRTTKYMHEQLGEE